ncbi:MAG TPA: MATE family efflux transporter [Symbiobacteriaceae bacterium]|nr:MATE family efflux transporter [Symbiobacteriaceae bacterium]
MLAPLLVGTQRIWSPDRRSLRRSILRLALPMVAEQLLTTLVGIVNMMLVSRLGREATAAVGLSGTPFNLSIALFLGLGIGTTALIARAAGAGKESEVEAVTRQSFWMGLVAALLVSTLYWATAPQIMHVMGADAAVTPLGVTYLRWSALGFLPMQWSQVMYGALRGRGDTLTPLKIGLVVNILNGLLSYALIWGRFGLPALGLKGGPIGEASAFAVGALLVALFLFRSEGSVRLRWHTLFQVDLGLIGRILKVGLPTAGERVLGSLGMISFTRMIASLGTVAIAAHQITMNAESIAYMPAQALAAAGTALVGMRLGAKEPDGATQVAKETVLLTALTMALTASFFVVGGGPYIRLYTGDLLMGALAVQMLRIAALSEIPMGITFALSGTLRGAGDTMPMMLVTAAGVWVVRLSVAALLIFGLKWGLAGAWTAMIFDWLFRMGFAAWRFRLGKWRTIKV